jgi:thymidine phosphorylase
LFFLCFKGIHSVDEVTMSSYHIPTLIAKKRDGKSFTDDEINFLIGAVARHQIDEAQVGECILSF